MNSPLQIAKEKYPERPWLPKATRSLVHAHNFDHQTGAILITGLILLLVLTIIGTSGMTSVTLGERMVSNMQNASRAFHGAEVGLSGCETNLLDGTAEIYEYGDVAVASDWWKEVANWESKGSETIPAALDGLASSRGGLNSIPRCVVEYIGDGRSSADVTEVYSGDPFGSRPVYRVSAFSYGADATAEAVVESMFVCSGGCSTTVTASGIEP